MRITNNMISSNLLINLNSNLTAMNKFNNQISTGKVISRPSDDPVIAAKALKLRTDLSELEQYSKNANDALSWIDITESAIKEYNSILQRIRELTVSASNGDKTIDDNKKISEEIKQLKEQLISIGNTTYAGRSVFTGFQTDKQLFDENGNYKVNVTSEYINNRKYTNYEVGINEEIRVNTYGIDLFGYVDDNKDLDKFPTGDATGQKAVGGEMRAEDAFDFSQNFSELTDETIEITIEGDTFTVPTSELQKINGDTTEKKDIIDILSNATNGSGGALKYSADIYFDNDKLVIASRDAYGVSSNVTMEYKGTDRNLVEDVFGLDDKVDVGNPAKSAVLESDYPVKLNEDYANPVITNETLTVTVDGTTYTISTADLQGLGSSQTESDILTLFRDAPGGGGDLDDVADISFDNGRLVIKADSTGSTSQIQVAYTGTNPTVLQDRFFLGTTAVNGINATTGVKTGESPVDLGADFSGTNITDVNMIINVNGTDYTINETNFNGLAPTPTQASVLGVINGAISNATATFDGSGKLVITANNPGAVPISVTYTGDDAKKVETIMGVEDKFEYGKDDVEATLTTSTLVTDADASVPHPDDDTKSIYSGQKMFIHLGDERKELTLGDIPLPATTADVVAAMQTAIDTAFGTHSPVPPPPGIPEKIKVNGDNTTNISFTTNYQNDGKIPKLFVDYERASDSQLFADIDEAIEAMETGDRDTVEAFLGKMDKHLATAHAVWSDVGARYNRIELINNRIDTNEVTYTKLLSLNEDVDQSKAIMNFKNQENVYRASLSMGSKIIQPSLVDFIK
jgi:flagellar hook-associated protein 3 FlgL